MGDANPGRQGVLAHVLARARQTPHVACWEEQGRSWSVHDMAQWGWWAVSDLQARGLQAGQRLVVTNADHATHWAYLMAAEYLGVCSISLPAVDVLPWLEAAGIVWHAHVDDGCRPASLQSSPAHGPPAHNWQAHELHRIYPSSGTGGRTKWMPMTWHAQQLKLCIHQDLKQRLGGEGVLLTMKWGVNSAWVLAAACLMQGIPCVHGDIHWALSHHPIGYMEVMPLQLRQSIDVLHEPIQNLSSSLAIKCIGAPVTKRLREESIRCYGAMHVSGRYACNEVWPIALDVDEHGRGQVHPDVDIQAVDETGQELTFQADGYTAWGQIWVRSPRMIQGYLNDPELTEQTFERGWFKTGDWGRLCVNGQVQIQGRCDDMLNNQGLKISAQSLEEQICALPGIVQAMAVDLSDVDEASMLGLALVLASEAHPSELQPILSRMLSPMGWSDVRVSVWDELPTTVVQKPDRRALREHFKFGE